MSATNRKSERRAHDEYLTCDWAIKRLLEFENDLMSKRGIVSLSGATWLDPCAGNGGLISVVHSMRPAVTMSGVEIREEAREELSKACTKSGYLIGDGLAFLRSLPDKSVDVVLTNPPFNLFMEFLIESRRVAKATVMLERVNAIRGDGRHTFMRESKPGLLILPDRPSFTGWGTDATEYAWFVWDVPELAGRWEMLGDTSDEEKETWNAWARARFPEENPVVKNAIKNFTENNWEAVDYLVGNGATRLQAIKDVTKAKEKRTA